MFLRQGFGLLALISLLMRVSPVYGNDWRPQGHTEGSGSVLPDRNVARPIAEFEPSGAVLVSHHLVQKADKAPMIVHMARHLPVFVLMPRDHAGREDIRVMQLLDSAKEGGLDVRLDDGAPFSFFSNSVEGEDGLESWPRGIWARDWSPISVESSEVTGSRIHSSRTLLADFNYYPTRRYQDDTPWGLFQFLSKRNAHGAERFGYRSLPIYNEGGNFMTDGLGNCFLSERPLRENEELNHERDIRLNLGEIRDLLEQDIGCTSVTFTESMPHEQTGHIDIWAKFINAHTVLISELTGSQERYVPYEFRKSFDDMRRFLNTEAGIFQRRGYRVIRIPQPVPVFRTNGRTVVRTYINSLLLNAASSRQHQPAHPGGFLPTLYVPRYVQPAVEVTGSRETYPDADLLPEYEEQIAAALKDEGLELFFVPSDDLIAQGGAVHCVTMQLQGTGFLFRDGEDRKGTTPAAPAPSSQVRAEGKLSRH